MNPYLADDSYPWLGEGALWNDAFANGQASPDAMQPQMSFAPSPLQQGTAPPMQPDPMQPVPMQMGGGGGGGLEAAFNSPWAAMAGTALNNLANRNRPSQDPIAAYQQAVNRRAILDQRTRAQDMQETRAEAQEKRSQAQETRTEETFQNPAVAYDKLVEGGHIDPEEMSFLDYSKTFGKGANSVAPSSVREWQYYNKLPGTEKKQYLAMKRAAQLFGGGGGTTMSLDPTGQGGSRVVGQSPDTIADLDAANAAAVEAGERGVTTAYDDAEKARDAVWANREAYQVAEQLRNTSQEYLEKFQRGEVDTGLVDAFFLNTFGVGSEAMGAMNAEQVQQTLTNLGITNLAPVTVQELQTVARLWASIAQQKEPNMGVLKRAVARTEALQDRIGSDTLVQANRFKQARGQDEYDALVSTNPFLRNLVNPPEQAAPAAGALANEDLPPDPVAPAERYVRDANGNLVLAE